MQNVPVGVPELLVLIMLAFLWALPLAAAVWAMVTLYRLRTGQLDLQRRLEAIERLLQR